MTLYSFKKQGTASKYIGVSIHRNGKYTYWTVRIRIGKITKHIANFRYNKFGEIEAAKKYDEEIFKLYGKKATLNFP